ncbi:hypothetical protein H009_17773 [Agrobacterium tumefaciens str. Cherry 2E-2-2]|nr:MULTISPECIES: putative entry exclusion protein TrbK-alt [Agrobacterium]AYM82166.1 conjugal transfer protein TrbK [Agrobacterium tumefaciens]EMS96335.1 hypothetical protein H009_17773 [Agrobacterium tumefaciens str. Cherry 2E-2-2]NTE90324.1 putative entry exclusion protein TrbK-alt [Agrobacterium tumefaciens]
MDLKIAARMIAVFALGAGLTAAIATLRPADAPDATAPGIAHPGGDPARKSELARCRDLGAAALEDAACRKAWADNRRRFFRVDKPDRPPAPKPERFETRPSGTDTRAEEPATGKSDETPITGNDDRHEVPSR